MRRAPHLLLLLAPVLLLACPPAHARAPAPTRPITIAVLRDPLFPALDNALASAMATKLQEGCGAHAYTLSVSDVQQSPANCSAPQRTSTGRMRAPSASGRPAWGCWGEERDTPGTIPSMVVSMKTQSKKGSAGVHAVTCM